VPENPAIITLSGQNGKLINGYANEDDLINNGLVTLGEIRDVQ